MPSRFDAFQKKKKNKFAHTPPWPNSPTLGKCEDTNSSRETVGQLNKNASSVVFFRTHFQTLEILLFRGARAVPPTVLLFRGARAVPLAVLVGVKRKCSAQYAHGRGAAQQHQPQNSSLGAAISQLVTPSSDSISTAGRQAGRTSLTTAVSTRQFCSCAHPAAASLQQPGPMAAILRRVGLPTKGSPLRPNCQNPTFW